MWVKVIGQSSMSNMDKTCFVITSFCHLPCFEAKGERSGHMSRSEARSEVKDKFQGHGEQSTLGAWLAECSKGINVKFGVKNDNY